MKPFTNTPVLRTMEPEPMGYREAYTVPWHVMEQMITIQQGPGSNGNDVWDYWFLRYFCGFSEKLSKSLLWIHRHMLVDCQKAVTTNILVNCTPCGYNIVKDLIKDMY